MDLPDELLLEILDYLPGIDLDHFQLPSLYHLSLTNRRLHALVSDKLYASYHSFFCAPYSFLRTVISNRHLTAHVRNFTCLYGHGVQYAPENGVPSLADKRTIKDGFKALGIPSWKTWASDCNDNHPEQELLYAAILMHTPNVTCLDIDDGTVPYKMPHWLDIVRWAVSGSRFGQMHQFARLKSIRVDVSKLKLRHLAPIFKLRSLREVKLIGLIELADVKEGKPDFLQRLLPAGTSPVENLTIQDSFVNNGILSVLLGSVQALKRFEYHHSDLRLPLAGQGGGEAYWAGPHWDGSNRPWSPDEFPLAMLNYSSLVTSLDRHRHCLEVLILREDMSEDSIQEHPGLLSDLSTLCTLTHLETPYHALTDMHRYTGCTLAETLPRSLKTFGISIGWNDREQECMSAVEHMATFSHECIPSVTEVQITVKSALFLYNWERLRKMFSDRGVNLVVKEGLEGDDEDGWESDDTSESTESDEYSLYES